MVRSTRVVIPAKAGIQRPAPLALLTVSLKDS